MAFSWLYFGSSNVKNPKIIIILFFPFSRIALISSSNACCYGTSKPRGPLAVMIRHLKILGYDCVLVRLTQIFISFKKTYSSSLNHRHVSFIADNGSGFRVDVRAT